jgi:hypothetical protein
VPNDLLRLLVSRRARRALGDALTRSFARRRLPSPLGLLGRLVVQRAASGPIGKALAHPGVSGALRWARRRLRTAWRGAAAVLAIFVAWAFANVAMHRSVPPPPWSAGELPVDPPAEQNGWQLLQENNARVALPREVSTILASPPGGLWAAASDGRSALDRFFDDDATRRALARYEVALALPRFADAQEIEPHKGNHLPIYALHRVGEAEVLRRALRGEFVGAFALNNAMLRADLDFAATAKSLLARGVASASIKGSLALSEALLDGAGPLAGEGAAGRGRAELAGLLGRLSPEHFDLRNAIVAENLSLHHTLPHEAEMTPGRELGRLSLATLFYDPGSTLEAIDARHREIMAHITAPPGSARPIGEPRRPREGFGWWLLNPIGARAIEATDVDWGSFVAKNTDARTTSLARRDALLARLSGS